MDLADPKCKDCHGKGEILLLNKTVKCFCLLAFDDEKEVAKDDPLDLNKMLNELNDINWPII